MTTAALPVLHIFVAGNPATKGSLRPWHKWQPNGQCRTGLSEESGEKLKQWRALIATTAARALKETPPLVGPVKVELNFLFPRPKSQKAPERGLPWVTTRGRYDIDKLTRAAFDALTDASVWYDDSQAARLYAGKRYAGDGERPGVYIEVEVLHS